MNENLYNVLNDEVIYNPSVPAIRPDTMTELELLSQPITYDLMSSNGDDDDDDDDNENDNDNDNDNDDDNDDGDNNNGEDEENEDIDLTTKNKMNKNIMTKKIFY